MNSETPPEKVTASTLPRYESGGSRSSSRVSSPSSCWLTTSNRRSAISEAMACKVSSVMSWPSSNSTPTLPPWRRPASSTRTTALPPSMARSRAPTSMAVTSRTLPPAHTAILLVPPPTSMFSTTASSRPERATAPEPWAAMVVSSPSPAVTDTNRPASSANSSAMARELRRRTATPVRISAPVSTSSRLSCACSYCWLMNRPRRSVSMVRSSV